MRLHQGTILLLITTWSACRCICVRSTIKPEYFTPKTKKYPCLTALSGKGLFRWALYYIRHNLQQALITIHIVIFYIACGNLIKELFGTGYLCLLDRSEI